MTEDELRAIPNKYKPVLCNMAECKYKKESICELYMMPSTVSDKQWCSLWYRIPEFKLGIFMIKIGAE